MGPSKKQTASVSTDFDFANEMRSFLQQDSNRALLQEAITAPLMITIQKLESVVSELQNVIKEKDTTIASLNQQVQDLTERSDDLEQYSRRNSLRVQGLLQKVADEDPIEKTLELANGTLQLNPPLLPSDIDRAHRTGVTRPDQPRTFLIKFATYQQRQRVLRQRQKLKNSGIYLNEDLTRTRSKLMFEARKAKRNKKLSDCWSTDGRIFVKLTADSDKQLIRRQADLDNLV